MTTCLRISGFVLLLVLCGCQRSISGTYLLSDESAIAELQLVKTPDNHLAGQIAVSIIKDDGSIERRSAEVTGAIDGENVTLASKGFLSSSTYSGTFSGDSLTLANSSGSTLAFKRASLSDYEARVKALDGRSQAILTAKRTEQQQRNFVQTVNALVSRMGRFDSAASDRLSRFPGVEQKYHEITQKIAGDVERERRLGFNPNSEVSRSQLSVDATQVSFNTNTLHYEVQSLEQSLQSDLKQLRTEAEAYGSGCKQDWRGGLTSTQVEAHNLACTHLLAALPVFVSHYDSLDSGLAHLEQVYRTESNAQETLVKTSEELSRR